MQTACQMARRCESDAVRALSADALPVFQKDVEKKFLFAKFAHHQKRAPRPNTPAILPLGNKFAAYPFAIHAFASLHRSRAVWTVTCEDTLDLGG